MYVFMSLAISCTRFVSNSIDFPMSWMLYWRQAIRAPRGEVAATTTQ